MTVLFPGLDALARVSAVQIVNTVVGSFLLAVMAWCVLRVLPKENAGTRFAVWMATLMAIAALPLAQVFAHSANGVAEPASAPLVVGERWAVYLFVGWAVIAGAMLLKIGIGIMQLRRLRASATQVDLSALSELPRRTVAEFQQMRPVAVCISDSVSVPTAVGFFRPAVLLPAWTLDELSPEDLNAVLVHEFAHLRRRDDWTNLLQKIVRAVFFFTPVVWWIEARLSLEREMACDEHVLAKQANARAYAECLVNLAEKGMLHRAVAMAQGAVHRLRQCSVRVARILESSPNTIRVRRMAIAAVGVTSLSSLAVLAHAPNLVAFRSSSPVIAANVAVQPAASGISNSVAAPESSDTRSMVVNAGWREPATSKQFKARGVTTAAHKSGMAAQPRTALRSAAVPVYRAELRDRPSIPATLVVVTERGYVSADGSQVWTMSVYRFAVLTPGRALIQDGHTPKRI